MASGEKVVGEYGGKNMAEEIWREEYGGKIDKRMHLELKLPFLLLQPLSVGLCYNFSLMDVVGALFILPLKPRPLM